MISSPKQRPLKQVYSDYTPEDFKVWHTLYERQMELLKPLVCKEYLSAIDTIKFNANAIPDFKEIEKILSSSTGWSLQTVPNISAQKEFFEFLSQKKFTATCWLRSMDQLDYLEEPDMFHDVFAHVPLLSNQQYCNFFKGISEIALEHLTNPEVIELLGRVYWFTIEFGLIREEGALKIYGAGVISSKGETINCLSDTTTKSDFNISKIFDTHYRTDILQDKYFVIDSFEQLYHSLDDIRSELKKRY